MAFDGLEAARNEWFIKDTEQICLLLIQDLLTSVFITATGQKEPRKSTSEVEINPKITSPASGSIIALDPDIPPNRQRVSFKAEGQNLR